MSFPVLIVGAAALILARVAAGPVRLPFGRPHTGLGDAVSRATTAAGVTPCQPCKARADSLNRWVRFG